MSFSQSGILVGVVGKFGTGKLDNGQDWSTDRIELHVLTAFSSYDEMTKGKTVVVHKIPGYAANYNNAVNLVDQEIFVHMDLIPSKKLGELPRLTCTGFSSAKLQKAG